MSKILTLKKRKNFRRVYKYGFYVSNRLLVLYFLKNKLNKEKRFGFVVSKKVGKAVVRNRLRRLLKEVCRLNEAVFPRDYDIVIVARKGAAKESFHSLKFNLLSLIKNTQEKGGFSVN
ncbi:MAG TPA: ribonuclease P protein component [Desulfotomaculum sp.]|nr:ribonuclease P protein component [Desulfotomaculum sp.]